MNKVMLVGNLTADPEMRTTPNGISVCSFRVAVSRRFKDAAGNEQTDFIPVVAWRQLAELCGRYLSKGRKVGVVGTLQSRSYEDKQGNRRTAYDVVADEVEFLTPRGESGGSGFSGGDSFPGGDNFSGGGGAPSQSLDDYSSGFADLDDSSLPF